MSKERRSLLELEAKRTKVATVLEQRTSIIPRIGTGEVRLGSSWENTLKVGRTRDAVKQSLLHLEQKMTALDNEIEERAPEYQETISLRGKQLSQMQRMVQNGNLELEDIVPWEKEYEALQTLPQRIPALRKGLDTLTASVEDQPQVKEIDKRENASDKATENGILPPLELDLSERLSYHRHLDDPTITVDAHLESIGNITDDELTPEQRQLKMDVATLYEYISTPSILAIYTPYELHGLVEKLRKLRGKNKADFDEYENDLLDAQDTETTLTEGVRKRVYSNAQKRRGMTWETLNSLAASASANIRSRITKNGFEEKNHDYLVSIKDPEPEVLHHMGRFYQFIADQHAVEVIGERKDEVIIMKQVQFEENCTSITTWYESFEQVRDQLPKASNIQWFIEEITTLVAQITTKLESTDKIGKNASYKANTTEALTLQKTFAKRVSDMNKQIGKLTESPPLP